MFVHVYFFPLISYCYCNDAQAIVHCSQTQIRSLCGIFSIISMAIEDFPFGMNEDKVP